MRYFFPIRVDTFLEMLEWSGGAMVLGKLPVPGRPTILITVGQGPIALAVGAGGCLDIFTLIYPFFPLSPSLWGTARYRLKYCLKGPLNPKPTNQPNFWKCHVNQIYKQQENAIKNMETYSFTFIHESDMHPVYIQSKNET